MARHLCAIFGIAVAVGAVVFMRSLVATNDKQSRAVAERLVAELPALDVAETARLALDYRPGGRVMQGPPLTAVVGTKPGTDGIVITKALFAQRRLPPPPVGTELTLVGRSGAYRLTVSAVLDWARPLGRGATYPTAFVSPETAKTIGEEWRAFTVPSVDELAPSFTSDAGRNFDRAKALLLWAAALTALCLLVNTLFLSVEARRRELAILRTLGLTKSGVLRLVLKEAALLAALGCAAGIALAAAAVVLYAAADPALFPLGAALAWRAILIIAVLTPLLACAAALLALKPALAVKPLEAASARTPRRPSVGMLLSFAFGFGGFVAVEVWGASLMKSFVPSSEWPDAIVSILPGGVSSFDIDKLKAVEGVERLAELQPLQVNLLPLEELKQPGAGRKAYRNALLLASDWLPEFRFTAGSRVAAVNALAKEDACVVTEMMARAHGWKLGDKVALDCGRGHVMKLSIVGIVDLNWHMVTSRGLVRGLNRMPSNTDGPLFVSFDTLAACDARPQHVVTMTHVWLDYKPEFLAAHGVFAAGRRVEKDIARLLNSQIPDNSQMQSQIENKNTVRLHARDEIADGTLAHGANLIGSMARVPFIFIAVVSLGFIAMLVAAVESRRREFAVLRAVGATRAQLAFTLLGEALAVAAKGIFFGLLGGALAGWLFTFSTRKLMANWGLPPSFAVPWDTLALGALGAVAFALLVAVPASLILIHRTIKR